MAVLGSEKVECYAQDRRDGSCKEIKLTRGAITSVSKVDERAVVEGLSRGDRQTWPCVPE
jgi:hypothetical protein